MRLLLLLSFVAVVWSYYEEEQQHDEQFHNVWIESNDADISLQCYHDGFSNFSNSSTTQCICKPYYGSSDCKTRNCQNAGVYIYQTDTCQCPPGFLGQNCEPVKCVPGNSNSFYSTPSEKTISVYIPSNQDLYLSMQESGDSPIASACNMMEQEMFSSISFFFGAEDEKFTIFYEDGFNSTTNCLDVVYEQLDLYCDAFGPAGGTTMAPNWQCDGGKVISQTLISKVIDNTVPNSFVYIVTNLLPTNFNDVMHTDILRKAIAKRIRVFSIVFPIYESVAEQSIYNTDPGLTYLRQLAESTFGAYITPYRNSGVDKKLGTSTSEDATNLLVSLLVNNSDVSMVIPVPLNKTTQIRSGSGRDIYLSFRTLNASPINVTFLQPVGTTLVVDTGFYKIYKYTATADITPFLNPLPSGIAFNVLVYTQLRLDTFVGISSNAMNDVDSPYGFVGTSSNLVARSVAQNTDDDSQPLTLTEVTVSDGANLTMNIKSRDNCQFSFDLGVISCNTAGPININIIDDRNISSVVPFMCVPATFTEVFLEEDVDPKVKTRSIPVYGETSTCTGNNDLLVKKRGIGRSFSIISRDAQEQYNDNSTLPNSLADTLFVLPGNILEKLVKFSDDVPEFYTSFTNNFISSQFQKNTDLQSNLDEYITDVMHRITLGQQWSETTPSSTTQSTVPTSTSSTTSGPTAAPTFIDYKNGILDTLQLLDENNIAFTDVFVIVDTLLDGETTTKDTKIYEQLFSTRTRLYFIMINSQTTYSLSDPIVANLRDIAVRSGGALMTFNTYQDSLEFFDFYFGSPDTLTDGLYDTDVVQQSIVNIINGPTFSTNSFYGETGFPTYAYVHSTLAGPLPPSITVNSQTFNPIVSFGSFSLFDLTGKVPDGIQEHLNITIIPLAINSSVTIYSRSDYIATSALSYDISTAFSSGSLYYAFDENQYPVVDTNKDAIVRNVFLHNSSYGSDPFASFSNSSGLSVRSICSKFKTFVNYSWACSNANDFYFVTTEFSAGTKTLTRTQTYVCISDTTSCLYGGAYDEVKDRCNCAAGFIGDKCQTRVCQNGGNLTTSNICECVSGFTGEFCELSAKPCQSVPKSVDFRTEISSLIVVIESGVKMDGMINKFVYPGVQLVVIRYYCTGPTELVLSTTNSDLFLKELNNVPVKDDSCGSYEKPEEALQLALDSQVTDRGLIVWAKSVATSTSANMTGIIKRLATQRTDIRVYQDTSSGNSNWDTQLATLGNGIIYNNPSTSFTNYFNNYIQAFFTPKSSVSYLVPPRMVVIQTGNSPDVVTIASDKNAVQPSIFIVHVENSILSSVPECGDKVSDTNIYMCTQPLGKDLKLSFENLGSSTGSYSIEVLSYTKIGYGFFSNGVNEQLQLGLKQGDNVMSIYSTNTYPNPVKESDMTKLRLSTIYVNGSISAPIVLPTTLKNSSCRYSFYSTHISCNSNITAYQAQIVTKTISGVEYVEQKVLACGDNALTQKRSFAFLIDIYGYSDTLYQMGIQSIKDFVSQFDLKNTLLFFVGMDALATKGINTDSFETFDNYSTFNARLDKYNNTRTQLDNVTTVHDVVVALQNIHSAVTDVSDFRSRVNVIYSLTQVPIISSNSKLFDELQSDGFLPIQFGGLTDPFTVFPSDISANLIPLGNFKSVSTEQDTINFMSAVTQGSDTPYYNPPVRPKSCVYGLSASVILMIQTSQGKTQNDTKIWVEKFISTFPSEFNIMPPQIIPGPTCDYSTNQNNWKDKSVVVGLAYYDNIAVAGVFSFCNTNLNNLLAKVDRTSSKSASITWENPANTDDGTKCVDYYASMYFNEACKCSRYNDTNVAKIAIWVPLDNGEGGQLTRTMATDYVNFIAPYQTTPTTGVYNDLANNSTGKITNSKASDFMLDPWKEDMDVAAYVQQVYTRLCRVYGKISDDTTAAPPTEASVIENLDEFYD